MKNRILKALLSAALTISPVAPLYAAGFGTVPFAFFKGAGLVFNYLGFYNKGANAWVTGTTMTGSAADGSFSLARSIALDVSNDVFYVADTMNYRIVKHSLTSGSFIGAIGNLEYSQGSCPPSGAAVGWCKGGNFATGTGNGMFSNLTGVALDQANGILFAVDGHRVTKINAATGAYIGSIGNLSASIGTCPASGAAGGWCTGGTFASGAGDGMFNSAQQLAFDSANDILYVTDNVNRRVSKFTASTGAYIGSIGNLSASTGTCPASGPAAGWCTGGTFAIGTSDGGFSTPLHLALDTVNDFLYVTDGQRVTKVVASSGAYVGSIGRTSASTGTCPAAAVAPGWCTGGTYTSGSMDGGFATPQGISVDSTNDVLYVAAQNSRLSKFTASSGAFIGSIGRVGSTTGTCVAGAAATGWCTGGAFTVNSGDGGHYSPYGLALDSVGDRLYVVDSSSYRVIKVVASSGAFVASTGGIAVATTNWTPTPLGEFQYGIKDGQYYDPYGLAIDTVHGHAYVTDSYERIQKINLSDGSFIGSIGKTSSSTGTCPASGAASGWCTGGVFTSGSGDGEFLAPKYMAVDTTNNFLFITDFVRIVKVNASTGAFIGAVGNLTATTGTCPASGPAPGWCTGGTFSAGTATDGMYSGLAGIAYDETNDLLYVVAGTKLAKIQASTGAFLGAVGNLSASTGTCPGSGAAPGWCTGGTFAVGTADGMFKSINGITYDEANDYLYVTDYSNYRTVRIVASTGAFAGAIGNLSASSGTCPASGISPGWCTGGTFALSSADGGYLNPTGIAYHPGQNAIYISANVTRVSKINATTGAFIGSIGKVTTSTGTCVAGRAALNWCTGGSFGSGTRDGEYNYPRAIQIDPLKSLIYIVDWSNNRISRLAPR